MVIDRLHKLLENKGCAIGCFGVMALMFLVSFVNYSPQCQVARTEQEGSAGMVAVKVGDIAVRSTMIDLTANLLENRRQSQLESQGMPSSGPADPNERAAVLMGAINSSLDAAYVQLMAKQEGVAATPETAEQALPSLWNQQLDQQKLFLEITQQIKPDASEAEIAEALKKQGIDLPAQKKQFEDSYKARLADPASQLTVLAEVSHRSMIEKLSAGMIIDENQVKASFDTFQFKRILLAEKGEAGKAKAEALIADIKRGSSFERLMERNSIDKPSGKERLRDRLEPITAQSLKLDERYKGLQGAKPGDVRGPIDLAEGTAIYKLIKVDRSLPPDYDKKRGEYRDGYVQSLASEEFRKKFDEFKKATPPVWTAKGLESLFAYGKLDTDANAPTGAARKDRLKSLLTEAQASLETGDPVDARAAALATYVIYDELWRTTTLAERAPLRKGRIESLELALRDSEDVGIRLDIVDIAVEMGDKARAVDHLVAAAQANVDPSQVGQSRYYLVAAKLSQLKKKGMIGAEDEAKIEAELSRWRSDREQMVKAEAEQKKQQEDERKRFEEAARKAREEAKKNPPKAVDRANAPKAGG